MTTRKEVRYPTFGFIAGGTLIFSGGPCYKKICCWTRGGCRAKRVLLFSHKNKTPNKCTIWAVLKTPIKYVYVNYLYGERYALLVSKDCLRSISDNVFRWYRPNRPRVAEKTTGGRATQMFYREKLEVRTGNKELMKLETSRQQACIACMYADCNDRLRQLSDVFVSFNPKRLSF